MQESRVQSLGQEDLLEKEMATQSHIIAWKIPRTEEAGGLQSMGSPRVGHGLVTKQQLPSKSNGQVQSTFQLQFSRSVVSDFLRPHGLQLARLPCPSPTPRTYSNSCPLIQWCHPTISSSVIPLLLAFNLSQHQGLFQWVSSSHQVAKAPLGYCNS